jgi:hypothetical protein
MRPVVESALQTPDGYWRVEVVRQGRDRFYRIIHGATVLHEQAALGTVERVLGDAFVTLQPAEV